MVVPVREARGAGVARRALLPALGVVGVRSLDVAILSHSDRDHCLGLLELSRFVEDVYDEE